MVWASSFSAERLLSSEIYRASSYSSRQRLSGIQPCLKAKLFRPASRISPSRSNTQLRPYLKERTMASFRRYRRIHSYPRTESSRDKFPRLPDDWYLLKWYFIPKSSLVWTPGKYYQNIYPPRFHLLIEPSRFTLTSLWIILRIPGENFVLEQSSLWNGKSLYTPDITLDY